MNGATGVLDIGKTNVKVAVFAADGALLWERSIPNRACVAAAVPSCGCREDMGLSSSFASRGK